MAETTHTSSKPATFEFEELVVQERKTPIKVPASRDESNGEVIFLPLIKRLLIALNDRGVNYCHWKSNVELHRFVGGEGDLDLLVSRADKQAFLEILIHLGFKEISSVPGKHFPGIHHYYGYDASADTWVHVHGHYQLVLGHDLTKNYHLPIEDEYLKSSFERHLCKVPLPEFEYGVLVIRTVLKYSVLNALRDNQLSLLKTMRKELAFLEPEVNRSKILSFCKENLPGLCPNLFDACLQSIKTDCPALTRLRISRQLKNSLKAHARHGEILEPYLRLKSRVLNLIVGRIFGRAPKKRLATGGAIIAIVGGDGSGKTTTVAEQYKWLSKNFDTLKVHMGKPRRSFVTFAVAAALKLTTIVNFISGKAQTGPGASSDFTRPFPGTLWLISQVALARDRYLTYARIRRFASNCGVVICDRFPLDYVRQMDSGSSQERIETPKNDRFVKFLMEKEQTYYRKILAPDQLIVLRIDPEIAAKRKVEDGVEYVRTRSSEIFKLDWEKTPAFVVDSSQPLSDVFFKVKTSIWARL